MGWGARGAAQGWVGRGGAPRAGAALHEHAVGEVCGTRRTRCVVPHPSSSPASGDLAYLSRASAASAVASCTTLLGMPCLRDRPGPGASGRRLYRGAGGRSRRGYARLHQHVVLAGLGSDGNGQRAQRPGHHSARSSTGAARPSRTCQTRAVWLVKSRTACCSSASSSGLGSQLSASGAPRAPTIAPIAPR
jgi:hypothetical protein